MQCSDLARTLFAAGAAMYAIAHTRRGRKAQTASVMRRFVMCGARNSGVKMNDSTKVFVARDDRSSSVERCKPSGSQRWRVAGILTMVLALSACGGGGDGGPPVVVVAPPFDIVVAVSGQPVSGLLIHPGVPQTILLSVGQAIEFDASEPVTWTLLVGGSAVSGAGVTVNYGGVDITLVTETDSRIFINTATNFILGAPLIFTLVATSTFDLAQVATIQIQLSN